MKTPPTQNQRSTETGHAIDLASPWVKTAETISILKAKDCALTTASAKFRELAEQNPKLHVSLSDVICAVEDARALSNFVPIPPVPQQQNTKIL